MQTASLLCAAGFKARRPAATVGANAQERAQRGGTRQTEKGVGGRKEESGTVHSTAHHGSPALAAQLWLSTGINHSSTTIASTCQYPDHIPEALT